MDSLRRMVGTIGVGVLGLGYAASQYAYFTNDWQAYAQKVDSPPVRTLAAVLFASLVVLYLLPAPKAEVQD